MIDTELTRESASQEMLDKLAAGFPVPRLGTALEVAGSDLLLPRLEAAGYITGAAFDINGGDLIDVMKESTRVLRGSIGGAVAIGTALLSRSHTMRRC